MLVCGQPGRHINRSLQRLQKCHQGGVDSPVFHGYRVSCDIAFCQSLGLHLQVELGIDVGGVDRGMPQPRPDRVDIHAGTQEKDRSGMATMPNSA